MVSRRKNEIPQGSVWEYRKFLFLSDLRGILPINVWHMVWFGLI